MGQIKLVAGEDRTVPGLGNRLVVNGQKVEVPDDQVYGYTCQTGVWEPADTAAKKAHKAAVDARDAAAQEAQETSTDQPVADQTSNDDPQEG